MFLLTHQFHKSFFPSTQCRLDVWLWLLVLIGWAGEMGCSQAPFPLPHGGREDIYRWLSIACSCSCMARCRIYCFSVCLWLAIGSFSVASFLCSFADTRTLPTSSGLASSIRQHYGVEFWQDGWSPSMGILTPVSSQLCLLSPIPSFIPHFSRSLTLSKELNSNISRSLCAVWWESSETVLDPYPWTQLR